MHLRSAMFFFTIFGNVCTHLTEIDLKRISNQYIYENNRRSLSENLHKDKVSKKNDRHSKSLENEVIQSHQPREDPRLFYQSEGYLQEVIDRNHDVTYIYPGREVVNANEEHIRPGRYRKMVKSLTLESGEHNLCIQCPRDRTLLAKAGSDKVVLQSPRILSCSGRRTKQVRFISMYGPKIGTLLHEGSYTIGGKIMYRGQTLRMCKMQVHVILQTCPITRSLEMSCNNSQCHFTCRDPKLELQGRQSLICGDDLKWEGSLPVCRGRKWCMPQPPPDNGKISCKGSTVDNGSGLAEGSRCRVRCRIGWKAKSTVSVCRRGSWNHELTCLSRPQMAG